MTSCAAAQATDRPAGSVVLTPVPTVVIHHTPHLLQVRLSGDVGAPDARAAARFAAAACGAPPLVELDLSRVTHIDADAVAAMAGPLVRPADDVAHLVVRARPGPVVRLLEAARLAEEDGGPATIVAARDAVRPPDVATEVVMRFYEALAGRDWPTLAGLIGDGARWSVPSVAGVPPADAVPDHIAAYHARVVRAVPGLRPSVGATESDGRTVLVRGSHVLPAARDAARFRHRWHVARERLVGFDEQVDTAAYGRLRELAHA